MLAISIARWSAKFDATLISKVNGDLTIAHQYLSRILETTEEQLQALGGSARCRDMVGGEAHIDAFLDASRNELGLDFLYIVDGSGSVLSTAPNAPSPSRRTDWPIIRPIFLRWARGIFMPLERVTATIGRVENGDLGARSGLEDASDEIGRVATHLDGLLDRLQERERDLRRWNDELNERVAERTKELRLANRQLKATTKQLVMSEKLAAIGEITAGVAHEINNPVMEGIGSGAVTAAFNECLESDVVIVRGCARCDVAARAGAVP